MRIDDVVFQGTLAGSPGPNVTITNPASAVLNVPSAVSSYALAGTNANIAGYLTVSNNTTLLTSSLAPSGNAWSYSVASLSMGSNVIVVTGTNTAGTRATASVLIIRNVLPPQNLTATALDASEIALAWDKNAQNNDVLLVRHTAPITGTPSGSYAIGNSFPGGGTVIYTGGLTSLDDTGLNSATTYYYKLWSYDGSAYSDGITASATTSNILPPVATAATSVDQTSFTANWQPVAGASGYLLDVYTNSSGGGGSIVYATGFEDASKNAYAAGDVVLSGITWNLNNVLIGTLANDKKTDVKSARAMHWFTNAVVGAYVGGVGNVSFKYARYGSDTGVQFVVEASLDNGPWTQLGSTIDSTGVDTLTTWSHTLNTSSSVKLRMRSTGGTAGQRVNFDDFTLTSNAGVPVYVPGYSNLFVAGTSANVTGLSMNSWYYYRVRAIVGSVTTDYSNVISVQTASTPVPFVDITVPPTNSTVSSSSFTLQGTNNAHVAGGMIVSNLTTGAAWALPAPGSPYAWSQVISLANGMNQIRVVVTNSAGAVAYDTVTITYSPVLPDSFVSWTFDTPSPAPNNGYGVITYGASPVLTNWPFGGGNYGGNGLIFTEIMVNPSGDEQTGSNTTEWLELYNTGPVPVNLLNYAVGDRNTSYGGLTNIVGAATIDVGEFVIICPPGRALGLTSAWNLVGVKVYEVGANWPNFNNDSGGDRVYLSNTVANVIVDEFTYTNGWPAFNSGQSMYLTVPNPTPQSNDVASAWAATPKTAENKIPNPGPHGGAFWGTNDYGTPGRGPYQDSYDSFLQCLGSDGWPATQDNAKYLQFAFNTNMTQVTMYMDLWRDANGPQNVLVQYSTDGVNWLNGETFSLPAVETWYSFSNSFPLAQFENQPNAGIRLVAYGASSTAGQLRIDNIYGTGVVPEPAVLGMVVLAGVWLRRRQS